MEKIIKEIVKKYDVDEIESALVKKYIELNRIKNIKNNLITNLLDLTISDNIVNDLKKIDKIDIYDVLNAFELLIPKEDKNLNGEFYTPKYISSFMVSQSIRSKDDKVCDTSCGSGAFLISSALYLKNKFGLSIKNVVEKKLFGSDIANYAIDRSKILLSLLCLSNNENVKELNFNLLNTDSLNSNLKELFGVDEFDIVIGNPPYVKFQDLKEDKRIELNRNWKTLNKGTFNLYFAFFELGVELLKEDGLLCYITPNNYFTSLSAINLRKYLAVNKYLMRVIDFNHHKVFKAQTYTAISFLTRFKNDHIQFARIEDEDMINKLEKIEFSKVRYENLNNKKWRLLFEDNQENIKKIESYPKLGDLFNIRVGIATCKDTVYFLNGIKKGNYYIKEYEGNQYLIEKEITRPIAKISDFKSQEDLDNNNRQIIFPYKRVNNKYEIITHQELKSIYPKCYEYFIAVKEELAERDKGKVEYDEWYSYARTQAFTFISKKLYTPTFSVEPRFLYENNDMRLFCNGYGIFEKEDKNNGLFNDNPKINLRVLQKILNSKVMDYYVKQTSVAIEGGYPCYQKNFIELFGIPEFTKAELEYLETEINQDTINDMLINKYNINL